MTDRDWDSPRRSRLFLAAALAVAVAGTMFENAHDRGDVQSWRAVETVDVDPGGSLGSAAKPDGDAAPGAVVASASGQETPFADARDGRLRDAVASPALAGSLSGPAAAARSAAFSSAAGGRVPGAFAPAAAGSAHAAAGTLSGARAETGSAASAAGGAAPRASARAVAGYPDAGASIRQGAAPVRARRRRAGPGVTPAERFFSGADLAGSVSLSQRPLSQAGAAQDGKTDKKGHRRRARRPRRLKPALLSKLLGLRALRAPGKVPAPRDDPWSRGVPAQAANRAPLTIPEAEAVAPPPACSRSGPHWHQDSAVAWLHDGKTWGRSSPEGWSWLEKEQGGLWLFPGPDQQPLLLHQGHWWLRSRGLWFLLHDGAPWGERFLPEWGTLGFVHPSGAQMIYSADGTRVGLIEPDAGAVLFDAQTGEELGRWTPDQLPRKRRPNVPAALPPLR